LLSAARGYHRSDSQAPANPDEIVPREVERGALVTK